jgi:hypothetical protein
MRLADHADWRLAAVARGIVQHHFDDAWFHRTRAFAELNLQLTASLRERLADDGGFRSGFLAHILIELLLDAALIDESPRALDAYYASLDAVDPVVVQDAVSRMSDGRCGELAAFIPRFSAERFLYDYVQDGKLLRRLNYVMRRVRLPPLPPAMAEVLSAARRLVRQRKAELLAGENCQGPIAANSAEE